MNAKSLHPVIKGIVVFVPPLLVLALIYSLSVSGSVEMSATSLFSGFHIFVVSAVLLLGTAGGAFIGYIAGKARAGRRIRLIASVFAFYWLSAVAVAGVIMLLDDSMNVREKITGALWLGSAGALIFGIFVIPVIIVAALALEYWTRNNRQKLTEKLVENDKHD